MQIRERAGRLMRVVASVAVLAGGAAVLVPVAPAAAKAGTASKQQAPYAVGSRSYTFVDTSRPTSPNGTYPGAATRTLPTLLLYPAAGDANGPIVANAKPARRSQGFPLVVFSHGFTATGPAYQGLLQRFVRAGYVVAAPTFPLSNGAAPGGPRLTDYVNQPADVSFVLTQVLRLQRRDPSLRKTIDRRDIGVAGHSLGAITTLGLARNSCCQDPRIDAAVAFSGIQLPFPGGSFTTASGPPLMLVHGDKDGTVPFAGSTGAYAQAPAPKVLLTLLGAPHTPFFAPWIDPLTTSVTDFLDGYLKHSRKALRRLATDGNVPAATTLQEDLGD